MATLRKAKASLLALIFLVDIVSFSGLVAARPIAMDQSDIVSPLWIESKRHIMFIADPRHRKVTMTILCPEARQWETLGPAIP